MPGHSRSKNGVASLAYGRASTSWKLKKAWMAGTSPAMTSVWGFAVIHSRDRILTTHVGSLPRSETLSDLLIAREAGKTYDRAQFDTEMENAVRHVFANQQEAAYEIGNDGEQQRVGFQTY